MDRRIQFLPSHCFRGLHVLLLLLLASPLVADGDGAHTTFEHEPIALRGSMVPTHQVFETFLLHASIIREKGTTDDYREFLAEYGLDPDLEAFQDLHIAFDEMEFVRSSLSDVDSVTRLGELFATLLGAAESDPRPIDGQNLWFKILRKMQARVSWTFLDEHPNFELIDEQEKHFREAVGTSLAAQFLAIQRNSLASQYEKMHDEQPIGRASGSTIKISHIGHAPVDLDHGQTATHATMDWRRYAREDGSVRVIGLVDIGEGPLSLVDMSFPSDVELRPEFKHGGIQDVLRFSETFPLDLAKKNHTSLACLAAQVAAGVACAACLLPPDPLTCGACAAALIAVAASCTGGHCDQIQCNSQCVQGCHLYGTCASGSCVCVGQRFDIPGCELPDPCYGQPGGCTCSAIVGEVDILPLDGSVPVVLPTAAITLNRLQESDLIHNGKEVSYLMAEWAVVDFGAPQGGTMAAAPIRTLRSSIPEFGAAQVKMLREIQPEITGVTLALADRFAIVVASPAHDDNSRQTPLPDLTLASTDLPAGIGLGKVAIRADFSESGELQGFEILADTMGGVSPQLAAKIEKALVLQRYSEKEHRTVVFAVLSVADSLELESSIRYLPKCCCGEMFCI